MEWFKHWHAQRRLLKSSRPAAALLKQNGYYEATAMPGTVHTVSWAPDAGRSVKPAGGLVQTHWLLGPAR